eukprot:gene432-6845_t
MFNVELTNIDCTFEKDFLDSSFHYYAKIYFDVEKIIKTHTVTPEENCLDFKKYSNTFLLKLKDQKFNQKSFEIEILHKKAGKDPSLGFASLDFFSLMTGPPKLSLTIKSKSGIVGKLTCDCVFEYLTNSKLTFSNIEIFTTTTDEKSYHSNHYHVSFDTMNDHKSTKKKKGGQLIWKDDLEVEIKEISYQKLFIQKVDIHWKINKVLDSKVLGSGTLDLVDYIKLDESKPFKLNILSYGAVIAYLHGDVKISNIPEYAQLKEGLNIDGNVQTQRNSSMIQFNNQNVTKEKITKPNVEKIKQQKNRTSSTAYLEQSQKKFEDDLLSRIKIVINIPGMNDGIKEE